MLRESYYTPRTLVDEQVFAALVPADHYLRRVTAVLDFERYRALLAPCYSATQARGYGLVKDRLRVKDATHVIAAIAIPSTIRLVAQMRQRLLEAVCPLAPAQVADEEERAAHIRLATSDLPDVERLTQRVAHL